MAENARKVKGLLKARRSRIFSPITYSNSVPKLIRKYVSGKCLDIGCGEQPYRDDIEKAGALYYSFDVERRSDNITYVGNIMNMNAVPKSTYDSALCTSVLEHTKNPFVAVKEIHKVLKLNGLLIVTVPHLSRIHEAPNDFFRFTEFGLREVLESSGFRILEIRATGGIFSFLGHQVSTIVHLIFGSIPLLRNIALHINFFVVVLPCMFFDFVSNSALDKKKIFASGYVCVARKLEVL